MGEEVAEPEDDEGIVRELFVGCCSEVEIMKQLLQCTEELVRSPALGLTCYWLSEAGGVHEDLEFKIGDRCVESMRGLGYDGPGQAARARGCLRAMAFVAAGRPDELRSLEAHPYHTAAGSGAPRFRDSAGRVLYRGWLFQGPDAHRLYWWGGECVEIVGVAGHDDPPPL